MRSHSSVVVAAGGVAGGVGVGAGAVGVGAGAVGVGAGAVGVGAGAVGVGVGAVGVGAGAVGVGAGAVGVGAVGVVVVPAVGVEVEPAVGVVVVLVEPDAVDSPPWALPGLLEVEGAGGSDEAPPVEEELPDVVSGALLVPEDFDEHAEMRARAANNAVSFGIMVLTGRHT